MAQQKVKIEIPKGFKPDERMDIGQAIITFIQERAINENKGHDKKTGKDIDFPEYTDKYASKKGVGIGDVDLVLSADMFNDMKVLKQTSTSVTIGFEAGTKSNAKAEGNQLGTYGQSKPIAGKARPFLGLTKGALKSILERFSDDTEG